jgi:hypothetical protein
MAMSIFEHAKTLFAYVISSIAEKIYTTNIIFLPKTSPLALSVDESIVRSHFDGLSLPQKDQVYGKIWELTKMLDPTINGANWGQQHVFDHIPRLSAALNRLGFFPGQTQNMMEIPCLPQSFGEGGIGSQYFSLAERAGRDSIRGQIGYVHGMGVPSLEHAGRDAAHFSDRFADGNNLHCIYHATHQAGASGDFIGFAKDVLRLKAVDGGSYTKTSYLIAQQCIDFLDNNPNRNFLQIAHSEGAAHVNAALRLISKSRPDLLNRIRVITFCPAYFILPETYGPGLQVINLFKTEDSTINPWAANMDKVGTSQYIITIRHTQGHPHNHLTDDYIREGKRYVDEFMRSGNIY